VRSPLGEPWVGERRWCEDVEARPAGKERVARRCCFDDPSARPSHAPPTEVRGEFEDIRHCLEAML